MPVMLTSVIRAIIFDLDVQTGFQRKANDAIDRIESSGIAFFESVRNGYQQLAIDRNEVQIIDASQPIDIISEQTKDLVRQVINA
jgi:thymidylate kinase